MDHSLLYGRSRMGTPDFSSFEVHKPAFEMQKPPSEVKSRISLWLVDAVVFILWVAVPVSLASAGDSQPCPPPCTVTQSLCTGVPSRIWRFSDPSAVGDEMPVAPWARLLHVPLVKPRKKCSPSSFSCYINLLKLDLNLVDFWVFWRLDVWCKWQSSLVDRYRIFFGGSTCSLFL